MNAKLGLPALVAVGLLAVPCSVKTQEPSSTGYAEVDGVRLHYRVFGQGDPLLLVHGFTNAGQIWDPFVDRLTANHSVIVPDLRGHGLSTNPSGEFTHRLAARDLVGLLDALGLESVAGVGHSSGAIALLDLALIAPERLTAMVLVDGAHRFPDETRASMAGADADVWLEALPGLFEAALRWHAEGMPQLRRLAQQVRAFAADPREGAHDSTELRGVQVPALIVHGDRDELYPVRLAFELYELLPKAELWIMPDVSHAAFTGYQFEAEDQRCAACVAAGEQFPSVVLAFLERVRESS